MFAMWIVMLHLFDKGLHMFSTDRPLLNLAFGGKNSVSNSGLIMRRILTIAGTPLYLALHGDFSFNTAMIFEIPPIKHTISTGT